MKLVGISYVYIVSIKCLSTFILISFLVKFYTLNKLYKLLILFEVKMSCNKNE